MEQGTGKTGGCHGQSCVFYWEAHCGPFQDMLEVAVAGWGAAARSIPHMSSLRASRRACVPAPEINFLGHIAAALSSSPPFDVSDMHVPSRGGLCKWRMHKTDKERLAGLRAHARSGGSLEAGDGVVRGNLERSLQHLPRGERGSACPIRGAHSPTCHSGKHGISRRTIQMLLKRGEGALHAHTHWERRPVVEACHPTSGCGVRTPRRKGRRCRPRTARKCSKYGLSYPDVVYPGLSSCM